jgi:hypothetical protein
MTDNFFLTDPPFRLFCILVWLVPLLDAIKPLNKWVDLGHCNIEQYMHHGGIQSHVCFHVLRYPFTFQIGRAKPAIFCGF